MLPLPIDSFLGQILDSVRENSIVIVEAAAGSGKTTRIPPALIEALPGKILILEPRRIAARYAARRVACELGEDPGATAGYQVRFEGAHGGATRLLYLTEGLLLRQLQGNPTLQGVSCVILDEFHERHLHTDMAFMALRILQGRLRPDLKLVLMSATIDRAALSANLPQAPVISCPVKPFPLSVEHLQHADDSPLHHQVRHAVKELFPKASPPGNILVFLPGAAEIRASMEALSDYAAAQGALLLELRSEIPLAGQEKVFTPQGKRKIILSTNVAETGVTVEGVTAVVDSGLARIAGFAHWSGLPTLTVRPVSQASALQRAGRAARTAPGTVKRLFTLHDFTRRPPFEKPEIERCDLSQGLLDLASFAEKLGLREPLHGKLPWLQAPPGDLMDAALKLLSMLGALDGRGSITETGRLMAELPLHPRLARAVVEGRKLGAAPQVLAAAALISEGMLLLRDEDPGVIAAGDVSFQRDALAAFEERKLPPSIARLVDNRRATRIRLSLRELCRLEGCSYREALAPLSDEKLAEALMAGFPDRVAQARRTGKRGAGRRELNFCQGGGGILSGESVVKQSQWLLAIEADEKSRNAASALRIRTAQEVPPELLVLSGPPFLSEKEHCLWDDGNERVRCSRILSYGELVLEERAPVPPEGPASEVLLKELRRGWPRPFDSESALASYDARRDLAQAWGISLDFPDLKGALFEELLRSLARGKKGFAEIRSRPLEDYIDEFLSPEMKKALSSHAPLHISIGTRKSVRISYEKGKAPSVAAPLQDFFGMKATPLIGCGATPLVVHLRAPNGRDVQVTSDLAGFWEKTYPSVRRELSRRYPRHYWPENPLEAAPRRPAKRR
ncbi:MAG: ATP-dependent helicase HrpB [Candidatus Eremiobacteraeota bacterium]|nr:ATP-dependent helicase HrpB [Candidatus Eremiobacteraeota bacterium]